MKRSSTGWPIDFTDNQLKILYVLADDKGHSEKEIAERMVDKDQYQVVYSKSLSDVDNVSKELSELYQYWSPALSKAKKLVNLIKPYCDIPKIGPEDAYAEMIVLMLRPELHEDHLKWLKENLEDSNLRYKEPCHLTKKSQV